MWRARRTVRARLALLYAGAFFLSGLVLLAIPAASVHVGSTTRAIAVLPGPPAAPSSNQAIAQAQHHADVRAAVLGSGLALLVLVAASGVLGWFLAGRLLRPLRTITEAAREISASNLHRRLGLTGPNDEFTELGHTLDDLFARLDASFDSQRRFVANASHELRTPLAAERTVLQVALADPDADTDTLRAACEQVLTLGAAQERLIDALLTLARGERDLERREPCDLAAVVATVLDARRPDIERRHLRVHSDLGPGPVTGDPRLVESLVANLVDNAIRYNTEDGRIDITTATSAGRSTLSVCNTGLAVPPEELTRLFQPFQRLGADRIRGSAGYGLGLAIVQAIAAAHDATVTASARPDGGLAMAVAFPPS
jgi:signal transduction histidine kinase